MKRLLAILLVLTLGGVGAAQAATDPPAAMAAVYFNDPRMTQIGVYLHGNAVDCVTRRALSSERAGEIDDAIDRYIVEAKKLVPDMQADFAATIPQRLSAKEMADWRDFFDTSAGRALMGAIAKSANMVAASQMKFCEDQSQLTLDPNNVVQDAIAALPMLDRDTFREFAATPSAKKISSINEAVGETNAKYKSKFELAAAAAGLTRWIVK